MSQSDRDNVGIIIVINRIITGLRLVQAPIEACQSEIPCRRIPARAFRSFQIFRRIRSFRKSPELSEIPEIPKNLEIPEFPETPEFSDIPEINHQFHFMSFNKK